MEIGDEIYYVLKLLFWKCMLIYRGYDGPLDVLVKNFSYSVLPIWYYKMRSIVGWLDRNYFPNLEIFWISRAFWDITCYFWVFIVIEGRTWVQCPLFSKKITWRCFLAVGEKKCYRLLTVDILYVLLPCGLNGARWSG
jgi:hypothetical protein